ncbi:hypothetical protein M0811_08695 [Anaeramoeba ignava]|uniref:Uncharacterized protein n=1 Tax=Anaeramoeba ignava TaxID=1746090 RepID=A0A9Q0LIT1_ANAIG|nr:hypothetical protein M0811_08695 [Anaeramoeba ignava]
MKLKIFPNKLFVFDPKIKKEENHFILQNFKPLKGNLIHFEFDFRSNIFQFLVKIIEEENIIEQIINNNNISYIGDFILWVSYYFQLALPKNLKEDQNQNENIKPKKVSEINLYNHYLDILFNHIRNFKRLEKSNENDLSKI